MIGRWLCLALMLVIPCAHAAPPPYSDALIVQARTRHLAGSDEWQALLHYRPNLVEPGVTSEVDSPGFFLAPRGKTDPEAELEATIRAFFAPALPGERHDPQCKYIARYTWLKRELHFDPARLPQRRCPAFEEWMAALNPQSLTLIFPTAYLNNPSSMFGHTLLRIDGKGQNDQTRLLAYAVSYGAVTGRDGGVLFAVKGIFGWYPGIFSIAPYYIRVRQYNAIENRDIWEYRLNFTEPEIRFMLMHLWELRRAYFYYYFFDENCSYHLLGLLDVARPRMHLTRQFRGWVIPSDTVRAMVKRAGLVTRVVYRPSRRTELSYRMSRLHGRQRGLVIALADGRLSPGTLKDKVLTPAVRARLLEVAYDLLSYKKTTGQLTQARAADLGYRLLAARSELGTQPHRDTAAPEPAVRPDQGHGPARAGAGFGMADGRWFQQFELRPAYHDLLDPPGGYVPGAQIKFMDLTLRHYDDTGTVRVEKLQAINIVSLTPVNALKTPVSWNINFGLIRHHRSRYDNPMDMHLNGGAGLTVAPTPNTLAYAIVELTLDAGDGLTDSYALGLGPEAGLLADFGRWGRALATAQLTRFGLGDRYTRRVYRLEQRAPVLRSAAVDLRLSRTVEFGRGWDAVGLGFYYYF